MNEAAYRAILQRLGVHPLSTEVRALLAQPLSRFGGSSQLLEVRVPWHQESLLFVPSAADADALTREGTSRGRIWTAGELADLLAAGATPEQARTVARAKLELGGVVVAVRPRPRAKD